MRRRVTEEKIKELKETADIVEVVSEKVKLKKHGKNYIGLCMFHKEEAPAFMVSPDKQIYHCFGCGQGGNVFSFIMQTDELDFVAAVHALAARYEMTI